jgi:hypothetical protein
VADASVNLESFELSGEQWILSLNQSALIEHKFSIIMHEGKRYLQEHRQYESTGVNGADVDARTKLRINDLAKLLHQPKERVFCIPRCIGWKHMPRQSQIAFLFELPEHSDQVRITLFRVLSSDVRWTLGQRFKLALALARCISQLQLVKWVICLISEVISC